PATLLALARTADSRRDRLIRDIHDGTLDGELPIERVVRSALKTQLKKDPACARRLETIIKSTDALYPRDIWRLGFIAHWTGGTMGLYRSLLPRYYGDVPTRDIGLIASEGRMSIPLADNSAAGVLAVTSQFFEFIPADEYGADRPTVLRCHELEADGEYFLLLTNSCGLFRYDIGDRIRVTGWLGRAPVIEFLSRDAHTASMCGEKLTENQTVLAMRDASSPGDAIVEFVLAPQWAEVPWYRLYVERPTTDLADRFDEALRRVSVEYESKRKSLRLGPVEVVALPSGAMAERDRRLRAERQRTSEQFKHQYLLSQPGMDADLARLASHPAPALLPS
ncbi:MAG TPA: GH3 auxin-responsive promoter family protein, partial [Phycisphaerae bacterium]|nr:GH3 auxin-responsive promoter family protein [Phycisphaerae bacterium]